MISRPFAIARVLLLIALAAHVSACGSPTENELPPSIGLSSSSAALVALVGAPDEQQVLDVTNGGGGTLAGLSASVAYAPGGETGWLTASLGGTTAPTTLTLTAGTTDASPGLHEATVTVSAGGSVTSRTVSVSLGLSEGEAPTITITSLDRAAVLQQGDFAPSDVQVTGEACHPSVPITALAVDGVDVPVAGTNLCEPFDVMQSSAWGLSTVRVDAANAFDRGTRHVQSYLRGPGYRSAATPGTPIAQGFSAQLHQPVLDDNQPDLDDVAAILEGASYDLAGRIPTTLYSGDVLEGSVPFCTDQLVVTKLGGTPLTWRNIGVGLTPETTRLFGEATLFDPVLRVRARYTGCLGLTTTVDGTYRANQVTTSGRATVSVAGGSASVAVSTLSVGTIGGDLTLSGSFIAEVMNVITSIVEPRVLRFLENAFEDLFLTEFLPQTLGDFIDGMDLDEVVSVGGVDLAIAGDLAHVQHGVGFLRLDIATGIASVVPPPGPAPALGAILAESTPLPAFTPAAYEAGVALKLDVLNQLFWSAWRGGAFDVTGIEAHLAGAVAGVDGSATLLLPPVVMPGTGGHTVDVGWGDLRIDALVDPAVFGYPGAGAGPDVPIDVFASARVGVTLGHDDTTGRLVALSITPHVDVQVETTDDLLDETAIADAIEDMFVLLIEEWTPEAFASAPGLTVDLEPFSGFPGDALGLEAVTVGTDGSFVTLTGAVKER